MKPKFYLSSQGGSYVALSWHQEKVKQCPWGVGWKYLMPIISGHKPAISPGILSQYPLKSVFWALCQNPSQKTMKLFTASGWEFPAFFSFFISNSSFSQPFTSVLSLILLSCSETISCFPWNSPGFSLAPSCLEISLDYGYLIMPTLCWLPEPSYSRKESGAQPSLLSDSHLTLSEVCFASPLSILGRPREWRMLVPRDLR